MKNSIGLFVLKLFYYKLNKPIFGIDKIKWANFSNQVVQIYQLKT